MKNERPFPEHLDDMIQRSPDEPSIDSFPEDAQAYIRGLWWENEKYRAEHAEARAQFEEFQAKLTEAHELLARANELIRKGTKK